MSEALDGIGTNDFKRIDAIFKKHYTKHPSKSKYFVNKEYEKFVKEEWEWTKGKAIQSLEEYLEISRTRRGVALGPKSRQDIVIIPAMSDRFPYLENILEEDQEEQINLIRRLLYVSMTRARNELYFIHKGSPSRS